jgi:ABC-type glycerol-3-phosphate transport system substrate-binding protein
MRRTIVVLLAALALAAVASLTQPAFAADAPSDRVVVMYFHRVPGCPTCQKMRAYTKEAVEGAFAQQIKDGKVELHYIAFEDQKNAALTKGYKVSGPSLIVARVTGNKVAEYKNLTEMWSKVGDKQAFVEYVQTNVKDYQK